MDDDRSGQVDRLVQCVACGGKMRVWCEAPAPHTPDELYALDCAWCRGPMIKPLPGHPVDEQRAVFDPESAALAPDDGV